VARRAPVEPYGDGVTRTLLLLSFFVLHWQASVFLQSFFLHRYCAHRQFSMSAGWERFFYALTWAVQGSSFLTPRAYAVMHRMHHAYSDTPRDPHSPVQVRNVFAMMLRTKFLYEGIKNRRIEVERRFEGGYPEWPLLDASTSSWSLSIAWAACYTLVYVALAPHAWLFLLLPFHWFMGPVHGMIVNWFGHRVGYRNFDASDRSRNTLVVDVLTMGELFQNNHHEFSQSPNFAVRWFEIDPGYLVMKGLAMAGVIDMTGAQHSRWPRPRAGEAGETHKADSISTAAQ
jgi:stearoyl-CoA desaturase (delta-9 desaturase)